MGNGVEVATDKVTIQLPVNGNPKSFNVHRQQVVIAAAAAAEVGGYDVTTLLNAGLSAVGPGEAMNVNGSVTPVVFSYTVAAGKGLLLDDVTLSLQDAGVWGGVGFAAGAALAVGLTLRVVDAGANVKATFGTFKSNAELARYGAFEQRWVDTAIVRFAAARGAPMYVPAGYAVQAVVSDNLTTIEDVRANIRGRLL